jgi:hypothetical protein
MKNYSKTNGLSLQQFISHFEELPKKEKDAILQTLKATMNKQQKPAKITSNLLRKEAVHEVFDSYVII